MLEEPLDSRGDLTQVVRGDARSHAHRNALRAVDQQIREAGRQDDRFLVLPVVIVLEIDALLVDVTNHLHGQGRHLALRVPRGGRPQVAGSAEIALPGHERVAQGPPLHQTSQSVVDRDVAVRMVIAHDLADHAGGLGERGGGTITAVVHGVQDATMDGLEAVAHVRQSASHDDAHGVVEVGALHLHLEIDRLDAVAGRSELGSDLVAQRRSFSFPGLS